MDDLETEFELTEPAFLRLLVKHEPVLRAYARVIVPDWNLIDEAIQEASVTMWQKRSQLNEADGFLPWAKVILRFKCLQQLEKLRSKRAVFSSELIETLACKREVRTGEDMQTNGKALRVCLSQFSEEHQELLLAPHRSNFTIAGLAERRKKTPNALYKSLARLRTQLAKCIRQRTSTLEGQS